MGTIPFREDGEEGRGDSTAIEESLANRALAGGWLGISGQMK
jgi:hypothetical protein